CHVTITLPPEQLPESSLADHENDMLDLPCSLTHTSRFGCQVYLTKEMDETNIR
ncbi:hypothetical protein PAXINDRAFT_92336, partial [Paxillus involutus ATCC 200175]